MQIALAVLRYFPHGGVQRDLVATANELRGRGHGVRIVCHTWHGERRDLDVVVLPVAGGSNHARAARFAAALASHLAARPADVVVGFDKLPGLDVCYCADPSFVTRTAHRPWPYRLLPRHRTFRALEAAVFTPRSPTRVLLLAERQRRDYQRVWGTPDERLVVLPPGVAADRRRDADAAALRGRVRRELGVADDQLLLLALAANLQLKGCDRTLRAIAALPAALRARVRFVAVGEAAPAALPRLAQKVGVGAQTTFAPGRDDVPALLQAADLLVHPARYDTTGTVLLEALVAGLPVLCSDACGFAPLVRDAGAGRVLDEPFAQPALDAALRELLLADRTALQQRALAWAADRELHGLHERVADEIELTAAARSTAR
ncbi:MAG: glycosyltransferase family 4 protein [Planctomycetes bacterium]|nr:glycosyltransferase family 4 protein [Planctomycetota bacterium]